MNFRIPLFSVLAFCGFMWMFQALLLSGAAAKSPWPGPPDLSGNFFQDVAAIAVFGAGAMGALAGFMAFDFIPMPWWIQFPLALICNGAIIMGMIVLVAEIRKAVI